MQPDGDDRACQRKLLQGVEAQIGELVGSIIPIRSYPSEQDVLPEVIDRIDKLEKEN